MSRVNVIEDTLVRFAGRKNGTPLLFLHAFGDTGQCYEHVIGSRTLEKYRLISVDLWGFGSSPRRADVRTVSDYSASLGTFLQKLCPSQSPGIIGHSIAASIAVEIAMRAENKIRGVFSIEGNLTPDDAMFTGRAADFDDPDAFKKQFLSDIWNAGEDSEELRHYYSAARFADAEAMWHLGRDAKRISADNSLGKAFAALPNPKIYFWSQSSTPDNTKSWIERSAIPNEIYSGAGHWPMVVKPELTAKSIATFFDDLAA